MWAERHNVNKTIQNIFVRLIIVLLAVVFGIISITSFSTISRMQGNARVINYAGIVRGATQRLIKQEMNQHPNDELVQYIDSIISDAAGRTDIEVAGSEGRNHECAAERGQQEAV